MKASSPSPSPSSSREPRLHAALRAVFLLALLSSVVSLLVLSPQTSFSRFQSFDLPTNASTSNEAAARPVRRPDVTPTFMLLRAVGNALPPRHDPTRTLQNLRFILEHERLDGESEGDVAKFWVLNRIVDPAVRDGIKKLFLEFDAQFMEIPFELEEYAKQPFKVIAGDEGVDDVHRVHPDDDEWPRIVRYSELYDRKTQYALSINLARNTMLEIGKRSGARWILPWDQSCFLTADAWRQIKSEIATQEAISKRLPTTAPNGTAPQVKYLISYMDRLTTENEVVLSPGYQAKPWEEPQIIFRNDSVETFDEQLRYGRRDKAALLLRLKVPGVWDSWGWGFWEHMRTYKNISHDIDGVSVPSAGYVVRLFSGIPGKFESSHPQSGLWREVRRGEGVLQFLNVLELRVMQESFQYHSENLMFYDEQRLEECKRSFHGTNTDRSGEMNQVFSVLIDAEKAMKVGKPWTITTNRALDPLEQNRFFSNYYDQRAGVEVDDGQQLREMVYNTTTLALAWRVTGDDKYAVKAVEFLNAMFVDEATSMLVTLDYTDLSFYKQITSRSGYALGSSSGIRHTATIPILLDAIRLLKHGNSSSSNASAIPSNMQSKLDDWMTELYKTLREQPHPLEAFRYSPGLYGLQYDLQVVALSAYLNAPSMLRFTLGTMHGRLISMISRSEQFLIPPGVSTKHYTLMTMATLGEAIEYAAQFNMSTHFFLADVTFGRRVEVTNSKDGGLLCRFVENYLPCCHRSSHDGESTGALDSVGTCVTTMQHASEAELFIYARLAKHAVASCPKLQDRWTCLSLAAMEKSTQSLSARDTSRYLLPPYPFLYR